MASAEFEERAYEAPLYNQLERGNLEVFTPGQVLEARVGFDRGLLFGESALWQTLGYRAPPLGAALGYYDWPSFWGPSAPRLNLPHFKMNLFLQAKRPTVFKRVPPHVRSLLPAGRPVWSFKIEKKQQALLETLARKIRRRGHVAYAAPAFHTNADLFRHTQWGTIVENSTFPSAESLARHSRWFYSTPGASGVANVDPEFLEEPTLIETIRGFSDTPTNERGDLVWLDELGENVITAAREMPAEPDALSAQFFDDLRTFDRLVEPFELPPTLRSYFHVRLFVARFSLSWLVVVAA